MVIYFVRVLLVSLGNLVRRLSKPPEYVSFTLDEVLLELAPPKQSIVERLTAPKKKTLQQFTKDVRRVKDDPRVKGVILHTRTVPMPITQIQAIRGLIAELKEAGKRVIAWSSSYSVGNYYLSSIADQVLLQPGGSIEPLGLRRGFAFFADGLKRVGVEGDFVQISPYKSAADMITKSRMTKEVREMANWMMESAFEQVAEGIAQGRGIDKQRVRELIDESPYLDLEAHESGLVDAVVDEEELPRHLATNGNVAKIKSWDGARKKLLRKIPRRSRKYVALIRIEGSIIDGRSKRPPVAPPFVLPFLDVQAGDLTVVQHARKVASDKRAAAAVVYVDSPGGSATASEAMAAALSKVAEKKPLVVSMGSVAGSGGYYVATPGNFIFAHGGTITGSIGVLSGKFVTGAMWKQLALHREVITRGKRSDMGDSIDRFTKEEREIVWKHISRVYDVFVARVSKSRSKTRDEVDAIGGGRVWTGRQAVENGLVDELGTLDVAISKARQLAGLPSFAPVREVKAKKSVAPQPQKSAAGVIEYMIESTRSLTRSKTLCMTTLLWEGRGGIWI